MGKLHIDIPIVVQVFTSQLHQFVLLKHLAQFIVVGTASLTLKLACDHRHTAEKSQRTHGARHHNRTGAAASAGVDFPSCNGSCRC